MAEQAGGKRQDWLIWTVIAVTVTLFVLGPRLVGKAPDYDRVCAAVLGAAEAEGTAILFDPADMRLDYLYRQDLALAACEPGSLLKPLTALAWLERHPPFIYTNSGKFLVLPGDPGPPRRFVSSRVGVLRPGDYVRDILGATRGPIDLVEALASSSNAYFLEMLRRLGFAAWDGWRTASGLFGPTGYVPVRPADLARRLRSYLVPLPVEAPASFACGGDFERLLAAIGVGRGIAVTPMQYAVFLGALVNGGRILRPHHPGQPGGEIGRLTLPARHTLVLDGLAACAVRGTGHAPDVPHATRVLVKTGTTIASFHPFSQNSWYCGVAEFPRRKVGFVVLVKGGRNAAARHLAGLLLAQFAEFSLRR